MFPDKLDKRNGFAFSLDGIDFYNGLASPGFAAEVDGKVFYVTGLYNILYGHRKDFMMDLIRNDLTRWRAKNK